MTLFEALIMAEVLVVRSFYDASLLKFLKYLGKHPILNIASDGLTALDHLSPATFTVLLLVRWQPEKLRQALKEASLRVEWHLALQFVHPVLESHHLTDWRLKVWVWTGYVTMVIYHGRLARCELWEGPHVELLSQAHFLQRLREL